MNRTPPRQRPQNIKYREYDPAGQNMKKARLNRQFESRSTRPVPARPVNVNEIGLEIPSKKLENYEPRLEETTTLLNIATGQNYKKNAAKKRTMAWKNYLTKRAAAASAAAPASASSQGAKRKNRKSRKSQRRA